MQNKAIILQPEPEIWSLCLPEFPMQLMGNWFVIYSETKKPQAPECKLNKP